MEARLCLRHRPSSRTPFPHSFYSKVTSRTHHLSFEKPTLEASPNICTHARPKLSGKVGVSCRWIPGLEIRRSSNNDDGRYRTQRIVVGTMVLACCIFGMMSLNPMVCPSAVAADAQRIVVSVGGRERKGRKTERSLSSRSVSLAAVRSGKLALARLLDSKRAHLQPYSLDVAEAEFRRLLEDERPSFIKLQKVAAKLEMSGKEDEAVAMLTVAMKGKGPQEVYELEMILIEMLIYQGNYEAAKSLLQAGKDVISSDARPQLYMKVAAKLEMSGKEDEAVAMLTAAMKGKGPQEVYELEMILIEMLIYQGNYEAAKSLLQAGKDVISSDARPQLYMAVINIMLGEEKEAKESWEKFEKTRKFVESRKSLDTQKEESLGDQDLHPLTYENFESTIRLLKQEIDAVRRSRSS